MGNSNNKEKKEKGEPAVRKQCEGELLKKWDFVLVVVHRMVWITRARYSRQEGERREREKQRPEKERYHQG